MKQIAAVLLLSIGAVLCQQDWHVGVDRVNPRGHVVHGHANVPLNSNVHGNVHGSRVFGGPHHRAQTLGGGLGVQQGGFHGGLDATHTRGQGMGYSATVGGSTRPGEAHYLWTARPDNCLDPPG